MLLLSFHLVDFAGAVRDELASALVLLGLPFENFHVLSVARASFCFFF